MMQDGEGWYRRAVNEGLESATLLFPCFMFNYVYLRFMRQCFISTLRMLIVLFMHRLKKKISATFTFPMYV